MPTAGIEQSALAALVLGAELHHRWYQVRRGTLNHFADAALVADLVLLLAILVLPEPGVEVVLLFTECFRHVVDVDVADLQRTRAGTVSFG